MKTSASKKNGWVWVICFTVIEVILSVADIWSTYAVTPDLTEETNFLVSSFGFGWKALIFANVLGLIFIMILLYITFVSYNRPLIPCNSFREYHKNFKALCPKKIKQFFNAKQENRLLPFAPLKYVTVLYILFRIPIIYANIFTLFGLPRPFCFQCLFGLEHTFCNVIHFHVGQGSFFLDLRIIILLISAVAFYWFWFYREYKINKKELEKLNHNDFS